MKEKVLFFWVVAFSVPLMLLSADNPSGKATTKDTPAVRSEMLVSTGWLAQHLSDPKVVILHVGGDRADYEALHIPGAHHISTRELVKPDPPGVELPPADDLKKLFESVGVSDDKRVILYAPDWAPIGARAYFTLDYLGHGDHTALLDGGLEQWMKEQRPLSSEKPEVKSGRLTVHIRPEVLIQMAEVKKLAEERPPSAVIVDARPMARYRMGHIPGAAPLFWEKTIVSQENPVLKAPEELRRLFQQAGATPGGRVVAYCEVGYQSSHAYFTAKYVGFDAVNYDGSFNEWKEKSGPIIRGDSRR